jgi:hypothetical protein
VRTPSRAATADEGLKAWHGIYAVLQHPRCLNCHQLDIPLQGDERRLHVPRVTRGEDNLGVTALRCVNCHNESGNNETSGTPGAPHWSLAPVSMLWQGVSSGEICKQVIDPKRNGDKTVEAIVKHMTDDKLVLWGWTPGRGREPVPLPHKDFSELVKVWAEAGTPCPQS